MLIGFFRKSYFFQYVVLILLTGLLWLGSFIRPELPEAEADQFLMPAYVLLTNLLGSNALLGVIFAFVLVLIEGFLFNYILIKSELVPKNTLIPAVVFIILISHSKSLLHLHPALIATLFLIIILHNLFQVYTEDEAYSKIFNSGFLTAVASFFYFPVFYFIFFIWLCFIVFRLYKWRDWLIPFTGLITPYVFLFTYYLWSDNLFLAVDSYSNYYSAIAFYPLYNEFSLFEWIITGIILLFFTWSFLWLLGEIQEKTISIRKRYWMIFWLLFITLVTYLGSGILARSHLALIALPVCLFISYGFSHIKRKFWFELILAILTLLIIFNNLKDIFLS
jgi:hypothetical protein